MVNLNPTNPYAVSETIAALVAERDAARRVVESLAERVAIQSALLTAAAELERGSRSELNGIRERAEAVIAFFREQIRKPGMDPLTRASAQMALNAVRKAVGI